MFREMSFTGNGVSLTVAHAAETPTSAMDVSAFPSGTVMDDKGLGSGTGWPFASMLAIQSRIASSALRTASSLVWPIATQPGRSGNTTPWAPASPSISAGYFMRSPNSQSPRQRRGNPGGCPGRPQGAPLHPAAGGRGLCLRRNDEGSPHPNPPRGRGGSRYASARTGAFSMRVIFICVTSV